MISKKKKRPVIKTWKTRKFEGILEEIKAEDKHYLHEVVLKDFGLNAAEVLLLANVLSQCQVTSLDLGGNDIGEAGAIALAEVLVQSQITSLNLAANRIGMAGAATLAQVLAQSQVRNIDLSYNDIGNEGAVALANVLAQSKITGLNLQWNNIVVNGAVALANVLAQSQITSLDLGGNEIGEVGAVALANVLFQSKITSLNLEWNNIGVNGAVALANILAQSQITSLDLGGNEIGEVGAVALASVLVQSQVTNLDLSHNEIGEAGASALANVLSQSKIINIGLWGNNIGKAVASTLASVLSQNKITGFDLGYNKTWKAVVVAFTKALLQNKVINLDLNGNKIGDVGVSALAGVLARSRVTSLGLRGNDIGEAGAATLAQVLAQSQVTSLDLSHNEIGEAGASALANVLAQSHITNLGLSSNNIRSEGATVLARVLAQSQVTSLDLGSNYIGNEGAVALANVLAKSKVTNFNLSRNNIRSEGATALAQVLVQSQVTNLNLAANQIEGAGTDELAQVLAQSKITSLDLGGNLIMYGGTDLARVLPQSQVTSLNLSGNRMEETWGVALAKVLAQSKVTNLNLGGNRIGAKGAVALAKVLAQSQVTSLNLDSNRIGNEGAVALAQVLAQSKVTNLNLEWCIIGDAGTTALARALLQSQVTILNLATNAIGEAGAAALVQVLAQSQVTNLDLSHNELGRAAVAALLYALKANYRLTEISGLELDEEQESILEDHLAINKLLKAKKPEDKKEEVLRLLQFTIKQNSSPSNTQQPKDFPILKLFVAPELPFGINVEDIKQCFSEIKDDLERLNDWLSRTSEDSSIHVIVSDIVLKNIKRQQLQRQRNDAYFSSSSVELKKQLRKLVSPNHLEIYKNQAMEHVLRLARRGKRVDDLNILLKACLEPAMFLNFYRSSWFFGQTRENFLIARLGAKIKELNWAITQHQRSLEYGDVCTDLAAIRDIYISYKEQFFGVYNSKPSVEREQNLKLMCEPRYTLGVSASRDYLCEEARMHLTPADGETEVTQTENKFGTHIVRQYGNIHFKYHMETAPCYPAVEYMVGSLYNMLAGASYGIAPTEIVKLYRPGCIDKPEHAQVLVASQSVEGVNLFDFLLRHAQHHPEYLQKIDLYSFSAMVITSLLSNPADGKADNYMVSFIPHENDEASEDNFKIKIVGIDNDQSFAGTIIKRHTGERAGQHFVEVQSVFYFFPQMQEKIHPELCDYLINQSVELLLINFIKALQTQNQKYEKLKEDSLLTESEWKAMGLPICFPSNDSLVFIYHKLIKIQSYLSKNKDASHATLFENLYPEMFAYYQQISSSESTEATAILDKFCKLAAAAAPSLEDAGIIMDRKDRRLTSKIAFKTMRDGGYLDRDHAFAEAVEEFIKALDFAKIPSIDLQRTILETLKELNCIEQLTLRNCRGLDDSLLVALATSLPKLKSIHLIGCPNVTVDGVLTTYDTNMHPKKLGFGLSRCAKITERQYTQIVDMQIPLELLANDLQNKYYGFPWGGNANAILHQSLSQKVNLSFSMEQMRFLIVKGLDINSHNDGNTSLNGYTALHIAAVNKNLKMLGLLLALGADPQKLDKYSQETPFQKAAKRNLFMPCYALSQAKNTILSNQERQNLSDLTVREIQSAYRGYRARKLNFKQ